MERKDGSSTLLSISGAFKGKSEVLNTQYGPVTVTHVGDPSKSPCVAYPEVGLNHRACFQPLLAASSPHSLLLKHWRFIFIDPPGCQAPDTEVPPEALPLTLDKLASQLGEILSLLKLREALGLGLGNGGWVLARCAAALPSAFCGLAFISPSCSRASWWEWAAGSFAAAQLRYHQAWTPGTTHHMARRLFAPATLQPAGASADLLTAFERDLEAEVPPAAARHHLLAAISRPDLAPELKQLRCRVLLLYGTEALYQPDCMALSAGVDKARFAMVDVGGGGVLLTQERPGDLLSPLQLFLTSLQLEGHGLGAALEVGV